MQYTPLVPASSAALVVAALVWFLYRLWLGQEFRGARDWSRRLDWLGCGGVAVAICLVVAHVVGL